MLPRTEASDLAAVRGFSTSQSGKRRQSSRKKEQSKAEPVDFHSALVSFALNNKKHLGRLEVKSDSQLSEHLSQIKSMPLQKLFDAICDSLLDLATQHRTRVTQAKSQKKAAPQVPQSLKRLIRAFCQIMQE